MKNDIIKVDRKTQEMVARYERREPNTVITQKDIDGVQKVKEYLLKEQQKLREEEQKSK